ncbi:RICIN domain-containing protein [Streptomyces sp. CAU 1734]|uniref:RICIN domain-containing protein n=1 Tax=Streptomyces sp. CAU 1734 TaxID=3140360 RepID=UPI0032601D7B
MIVNIGKTRRTAALGAAVLGTGLALTLGTLSPAAAGPATGAPVSAEPRAITTARVSLRLAADAGQAADVAGASTANGAEVIQWAASRDDNQRWELTPTSNGYHTVKAVHSGKCLNVENDDPEDGARIIQWTCGTDANEQWKLVPAGIGYQLVVRSTGKCLNVEYGVGQGNRLIQYTCTPGGADNDVWLAVVENSGS